MPEQLQEQADRFRASGLLGKPGALSRLFDFLLARSLAGEAPKEIEIALQVFGKNPSFDVSQDSVVRVYVHKLRRRLDEFYAREPSPSTSRIAIPRGEYRLTVELAAEDGSMVAPVDPSPTSVGTDLPRRSMTWAAMLTALILAVGVGAFATSQLLGGTAAWDLRSARSSSLWAPLLKDGRPITIVVGDYYLIGETDETNKIRRLVREFHINSREDLMSYEELNAPSMPHYRNLDLSYLPAAAAHALQDIAPILAAKKNVRVVLMSEVEGSIFKTSHVVYVGYVSGMGMLGDTVFSGSRVSPGGTFDELVDSQDQITYVSRGAGASSNDSKYTDYGYISTFAGPADNRIVIISGTRDSGVTYAAEVAANPALIHEISTAAGASDSFESLYEVHGVAKASISAKRMFASALKATNLWDGD